MLVPTVMLACTLWDWRSVLFLDDGRDGAIRMHWILPPECIDLIPSCELYYDRDEDDGVTLIPIFCLWPKDRSSYWQERQ